MDKENFLKEANQNIDFFGNPGKQERERIVAEWWCQVSGIDTPVIEIGEDPPDIIINGTVEVEIVEILPLQRKRSRELKKYKKKVLEGDSTGLLAEPIASNQIQEILPIAQNLIVQAIKKKVKKYENKYDQSKDWILVAYINVNYAHKFPWESILPSLRDFLPFFKGIEFIYGYENQLYIKKVESNFHLPINPDQNYIFYRRRYHYATDRRKNKIINAGIAEGSFGFH